VRRDGPDVVVSDLGSTNGTRVNGAQVRTRRLNDGDEITVGRTSLRFEVR
jgi:pSer/pThr/pTyr-binding forkhead associated (FHA) protein